MDLAQVVGLAVDVGLGTIAYRVAVQLKAIVTALEVMVKSHDVRIAKLEEK